MKVPSLRLHSLSTKLLMIHLPLVLVAVATVFGFIEVNYYRTERAQLVDGLRRAVYVQGPAFESALWEFDLRQVQALLAEQSRLPNFQSAAVYGVDGKLVAKSGDTDRPPESPDFRVDAELSHIAGNERQVIGRLVMTAHGKSIRDDLMRHLQVNGITLLALMAALVGGTVFGTRVIIGRPIEAFRRSIESSKDGGTPELVKWESRDEIGDVVRAYNAMQEAWAAAEEQARRRTDSTEKAHRATEAAKSELQDKLAEIERFNRLAVGREGRIVDLKAEVNELCAALGRDEPYASATTDGAGEAAAVEPMPPTPEMAEEPPVSFADMVDLDRFQQVFESFCGTVGVAAAIIDLEGKILVAARWQRACTQFHRQNEMTCARCIESDTDLALKLQEGKEYSIYRCRNGLTDCASPIVVDGRHIANVFIGQFLLSAPDLDFFAAQAREVGFDEAAYLAAIREVPVIAEDRLPAILGFLNNFARLAASQSMERRRAERAEAAANRRADEIQGERQAAISLAEDADAARTELSVYKDQLEVLVEERTSRLQSIIDTAVDGVIVISETGIVESFSPSAVDIFGYAADEVVGRNVSLLMPEAIAAEHDSHLHRYMDGGPSRVLGTNTEVNGRRKDGSIFPMEIAIGEAFLGEERIFTGIVRDISSRKAAEDNLARAEEQNRLLLGSVGDGIFGTDAQGRVIFANIRALELLGYDADTMMGRRVHDLIHHSHADGSPYPIETCPMWRAYTDGTSSRIDDELLWRKDGTPFPVEYSAAPMKRGEAIIGSVVAFRDITERKEAQAKLSEAYDVIASSIEYASRIQRSLLPDASTFSTLLSDSFVLWEPRDRVGGDAYWCANWGRGGFIALGDCTGHGVPGAFMTIIANGALEMALLETPPGDPAALLQRTHQLIQSELSQDHEGGESDDGMELGICHLAPRSNKLVFAGARFSLFVIDGDTVTEIRGDKQGLGYRGIPRNAAFTNQEVDLVPGRAFYMTSDGLIDQVGGAKRLGFGKRRFKELLCEVATLPMAEQQSRIIQALADHQGDERRRDDVTVIGFRLDGGR